MALKVRRVVTGHDKNGKATVKIDDLGANHRAGRANHEAQLVWTTDRVPVRFAENEGDMGAREVGTTVKGGSVFRVVEYGPGVAPRNHRTDSIDYAVVISGEIDMDLDGTVVHLKAGDVLVQRATIHNWINNGRVPCVIAFVLISAEGNSAVG
jgi:quercetin dioxygenase-like cupin family protein